MVLNKICMQYWNVCSLILSFYFLALIIKFENFSFWKNRIKWNFSYCIYAYLMQQLLLQTFIVCMTVTVKLMFGRVIAVRNRNITKVSMADSNKEGM